MNTQEDLSSARRPVVVEIPRDISVNRFAPTYSIWNRGDFLRTANGSRRAWSCLETAEAAIRARYPVYEIGRCELCGQRELCARCGG